MPVISMPGPPRPAIVAENNSRSTPPRHQQRIPYPLSLARAQATTNVEVRPLRDALPQLLPALRSYARALCRNSSAADDLVQETALRALAAEGQWEPNTNLRAWLFTIQRNLWLSTLKRHALQKRYLDQVASKPGVLQPDLGSIRDLQTALSELPAAQREALLLVAGQGISLEEAATLCDVPVSTIKARMHRGRLALRRICDDADKNCVPSTWNSRQPHGSPTLPLDAR